MKAKEDGLLRIMFGVAVLFLLVACSSVSLNQPGFTGVRAPLPAEPLPDYILSVWPTRNEPVPAAALTEAPSFASQRGVGARVSGFKIDQPSLTPSPPLANRVTLLVNGTQVANDTLRVEDELGVLDVYDDADVYLGNVYTGPFRFSWMPTLGKGSHVATLRIQSNTGALLEYSWEFILE